MTNISIDTTLNKLSQINYNPNLSWEEREKVLSNSTTTDSTDADSSLCDYDIGLNVDEILKLYEDTKKNGGIAPYSLSGLEEESEKVTVDGDFDRDKTEAKISELLNSKELKNYKIDGINLSVYINTGNFDQLNDVQLNNLVLTLQSLIDAKKNSQLTQVAVDESVLKNYNSLYTRYNNTLELLKSEIATAKDPDDRNNLIELRDKLVCKKIGVNEVVLQLNKMNIKTNSLDNSAYVSSRLNEAYDTINLIFNGTKDSVDLKLCLSNLSASELKVVISKVGVKNFLNKVSAYVSGTELNNVLSIVYVKLMEEVAGDNISDIETIVKSNYTKGSFNGYSALEIARVIRGVETNDPKLIRTAATVKGYKLIQSATFSTDLSIEELKKNIKDLATF